MDEVIRKRPVVEQTATKLILQAEADAINTALTEEQGHILDECYANLNGDQIKAARLEATGIVDRTILADQVGVVPASITNWRSNPYYKQIVTITSAMLGQYSREFRANCERMIIAPAFAELATRMSDKDKLKLMDTKELIEIIVKISKELRHDMTIATDNEDDNDLTELQKIRQINVIRAQQADAVKKLTINTNIIEFPRKVANG